MALRNIVKKGDDVLLKNCREVKDFNPRVHKLIDDMRETLLDSGGVGLAAPQVGVWRRVVLVLDTKVEPNEIIELINPEIIETEGEQTGMEGCLSRPGYVGTVTRPERIVTEATDEIGEHVKYEFMGFRAVVSSASSPRVRSSSSVSSVCPLAREQALPQCRHSRLHRSVSSTKR